MIKEKSKLRIARWIMIVLVFLVAAGYAAFQLSPWPSALLIRYAFNKGGEKTAAQLLHLVPKGIDRLLDISYERGNPDCKLDVYYPHNILESKALLPVIVWVHGGAWIAGSKEQIGNYCKILADKGYVVVAVDYSLAPRHTYPAQLQQVNQALNFLKSNAVRFHINAGKFVLAGDSGGSQIAAQLGTVISSAKYALETGIKPAISKSQLSATLLYCGAYQLAGVDLSGKSGWFLKTVLWSFTGEKNFMNNPKFDIISLPANVTADFPPTFISVGNDDPLAVQSHVLAARLATLGVSVDSLFYAPGYQPALPHEYQFNLDQQDGRQSLLRSIKFLNNFTGGENNR